MKTLAAILVMVAAASSLQARAQGASAPIDDPQAQIDHLCETIPLDPLPLTFCFERPKESVTSAHVVYFFHGIRGSAEDFFGGAYALALRALQRHLGDKAPLFVSLSLGPEGIIKGGIGAQLRGLFPEIERRIGVTASAVRRDLVGASMGGHNAAQVAVAGAGQFHSMTLLCPAIIDFDPHDPQQLEAYRKRHAAYLDQNFFEYLLKVFRREFPSSAEWSANTPFGYLAQGAYDGLPMFVSVGRSDSLGFAEGAGLFAQRMQARQGSAQWAPVWGRHCAFDVQGLIRFLTP